MRGLPDPTPFDEKKKPRDGNFLRVPKRTAFRNLSMKHKPHDEFYRVNQAINENK